MMSLFYVLFACSCIILVTAAPSPGDPQICTGSDVFLCADGQKCIPYLMFCNGEDDCADGSDEQNCQDAPEILRTSGCAEDQYQCNDHECISIEYFCDGDYNCPDKSDEYIGCVKNETCKEFRCKNGDCVKNAFICNGIDDCSDSSDEADCGNQNAEQPDRCNNEINRFLCENSRCISLSKTCDGEDDCGDNSDEISSGCVIAEESCKKGIGCSHTCNKTPAGPVCSCPKGYKLINNQTCSEISKCIESPEICDHFCEDTGESYSCLCEVGYQLQADGRTCEAEDGEALMIYSSKKEIRGFYLESSVNYSIARNLQHVVGVSSDANYIYWSDVQKGNEAIIRSHDDGSEVERIVTSGLGYPEEIAIDWITGNIYFTDNLRKQIGVCTNDGSYCTAIIHENVDMPHGLVLYPINGEMYWSDFGVKSHISIAGMDGKERKALITENLGTPNGLAIDYPSKRLYWVDAKRGIIESAKLDGTDRREVIHTNANHPYSIAIFENKVYWSDLKTKSINAANKLTGENQTTIVREVDAIYGIHVYHSVLQPELPNPCGIQACSQLCLLASNRPYSCACILGNELLNDNHTCEAMKKEEHLVITVGESIINYNPEILGRPKTIRNQGLKNITHVTYDSIADTLLAYDQLSSSIVRFNPKTDGIDQIMNISNSSIGGIDFDYYGNNLYWSDKQNRNIKIYSMESKQEAVLQFTEEPQDILVIPEHGIMYVVFKSKEEYHIDKLEMSDHGTIEHIFEKLSGPKISLAYDRELEQVMMADQGVGIIHSISIDGANRTSFRSGLRGPVSLAVLGKHIFWTLENSTRLEWADKQDETSGNKNIKLDISHGKSVNLVAMSDDRGKSEHKCRSNNGGCSHVCLVASAQQYICSCPLGMILNPDNQTCAEIVCKLDEIRCSNSSRCINNKQRCNGIQDCPNGEDEEVCDLMKTKICGEDQFICRNGQCIDMKRICDSNNDCGDKSDEENCDKNGCNTDEFQCSNRQCIVNSLMCDGKNDCADQSDETNCVQLDNIRNNFREESEKRKTTSCPPTMFKCLNKRCLEKSLLCNQVDNCGDNSDEENCDNNGGISWEVQVSPDGKAHFSNVKMSNFTFSRFWAPGRSTTFRFSQRLAVAVEP